MLKKILFTISVFLMFSSYQVFADTLIQKMPGKNKGPEGYVIMIQTPTGKHCWGMPQRLDLSYLPDKPMDVEAAAKKFHWKKPTAKQLELCEKMQEITWKVYSNQEQATQPVYKIADNIVTDTKIDDVDTNTLCGDYVASYGISEDQTWRRITGKTGKQGAALCKEYK